MSISSSPARHEQQRRRPQRQQQPMRQHHNSFSLQFVDPNAERDYLQHFQALKSVQDWVAAWVYVLMVLPGFTAQVVAATMLPALWTDQVAGCVNYTTTSIIVLGAHLALLLLLRPQVYRTHRTQIITTVRIMHTLSSVCNGLQTCCTITKWGDMRAAVGESPFSAFIWRTGIMSLFWHSMAFRLPFTQHFWMQSATAMAYVLLLAGDVCAELGDVQHGPQIVLAGHRVLQVFAGVWHVVPYSGGGAAARSNIGFGGGSSTSSSSAGAVCLFTVRAWQVLLGYVGANAVLWCVEAADRKRWWQRQQQVRQREHEAALEVFQQRRPSSRSPSSSPVQPRFR